MALKDNLISYYKLDGNSIDSMGLYNGTDTAITYAAAKINQGAGLNGSTSAIDVGNITQINGLQKFSINVWVKITTVSTTQYGIVTKWDYATQGCFAFQTAPAAGELRCFLADVIADTGANAMDTTNAAMASGIWYMLTLVYDGTLTGDANRLKIFRNTTLLTTVMAAGTISPNLTTATSTVKLGRWGGTLTRFLDGNLDEVGLWSKALTVAEISELYNGGLGLSYPFGTGNFFQFF